MGCLDILVHSIAWAPKDDLQAGLLGCSADGFAKAMDISCHSFIRMARLAAPLRDLVDIMDVGRACAYLATPQVRRITGGTFYVDGGVNIMA